MLVCNNVDCDTPHEGRPGDVCPTCGEGRLVRGQPIRTVVREVTHHGTFRNERTIDLPAVVAVHTEHMTDILADCPYSYSNANPSELAASLRRTGEASHGWTTWTVVGGSSNIIQLPTGGNA